MEFEQQLKELEHRRKRGMRLLADGVWPAEVARRVGVSRQSVLRWTKLHSQGGVAALKRTERFGRPPKLNEAQRAELMRRRVVRRLCERTLDTAAHRASDPGTLWRRAVAAFGLAHAAKARLERAATDRPCARA
jgi:transposase